MKNIQLHHLSILGFLWLSVGQTQQLELHKDQQDPPSSQTTDIKSEPTLFQSHTIQTISVKQAPHRITRTVIEDSKGHIWIASWDGVFRFNGRDFQNITKDVSDARFFTVLEDRQNNFWLASIGSGVYHFDGQSFNNYTTKNGLINDRVTNIYEDHVGRIWIGTEGGISIFDGSKFSHLTVADGLPDNRTNSVTQDANGKYWIGTSGQTAVYDPAVKSFTIVERADGLGFENVRHIIKGSKGDLWLAGSNGLWRYDYDHFVQFSAAFTGYVFEDRSGNIMTSSVAFEPEFWVLNALASEQSDLIQIVQEKGMIFGFTKDAQGQIWYGTLNGLYRYNGESMDHYVVDQ